METETRVPSAVDSEGLPGSVLGQTLIKTSSIRRWGPAGATKNPGAERRQGRNVLEQTDSPLALFFVVAISRAQHALNHSTSPSGYHQRCAEARILIWQPTTFSRTIPLMRYPLPLLVLGFATGCAVHYPT